MSVLRLWCPVPWRSWRMLPASRSAARARSVNPGEAGGGASGKVEKRGADSVPRPHEDEGSSAQESADVKESGARASPPRVWSFRRFRRAGCLLPAARRPQGKRSGNGSCRAVNGEPRIAALPSETSITTNPDNHTNITVRLYCCFTNM